MSTQASTIEYILDQACRAGEMRARRMFGNYALYCDDKVVGLVCEDQLFIKITEPGRAFIGDKYQEGRAYPGAKLSMLIDGDMIEERERLCELIRLTADALPMPRPKLKRERK